MVRRLSIKKAHDIDVHPFYNLDHLPVPQRYTNSLNRTSSETKSDKVLVRRILVSANITRSKVNFMLG